MSAGARQKCHAASMALRLLNDRSRRPILPCGRCAGEIEDGAVLQIEKARHMRVDERVEIGPAHQRCDHAFALDHQAHGVGRQIARDRRAVPEFEAELEIEGAVRLFQKAAEHLQPSRPTHVPPPGFGGRLGGAAIGNNAPERFNRGKTWRITSGFSEIRRDALDLPILVADGLEAAAALVLGSFCEFGRAGIDLPAPLRRPPRAPAGRPATASCRRRAFDRTNGGCVRSVVRAHEAPYANFRASGRPAGEPLGKSGTMPT